MHMKNCYINGLPPNDTKVVLFDNKTFNSSGAIRLWEGQPDENGFIHCEIPKKYKKVHLVVINKAFEHLGEKLNVDSLGLFHTVKLKKCILHDQTKPLPINPDTAYIEGQDEMRKIYRNAKYRNYGLKSLFFLATVGAAFIGWFIAGLSVVRPGLIGD